MFGQRDGLGGPLLIYTFQYPVLAVVVKVVRTPGGLQPGVCTTPPKHRSSSGFMISHDINEL